MDPLIEAHERWRAERIAELTKEDGWLTLTGLVWLDDGEHRVGSAADCAVLIPAVPPLLGTLRIAGDAAEWRPANGTPQPLASDADGAATLVRHGRASFFLIERDGRLALRLRDADSPVRLNFHGIDAYPYAPDWRLEARWDGARAHFALAGGEYALRPQKPDARQLHFVIADATGGRETYGGGRFLFATPPRDGTLILDFNRAINPPCAFTPFAVCPLPPAENRLPFAIAAGEKTWRG